MSILIKYPICYIVYAGDVDRSRCYNVIVNNNNTTEMFFPADVLYLKQGNEEVFGVEYYNNMVKVGTTFDAFEPSNLFVIDKDLNTYEDSIEEKLELRKKG